MSENLNILLILNTIVFSQISLPKKYLPIKREIESRIYANI